MENYNSLIGSGIKMIVSDIDGTLLNSQKGISKENMQAIQEARDKGILFSICTGRIATMTECYTKILNIDTPIITTNGGIIWDSIHRKTVFDVPMDAYEAIEIMDVCKSLDLDYCALTLGTSYFSRNSIRVNRFLEYNQISKELGMQEMKLDYFDEQHNCMEGLKVYKILINDPQGDRVEILQEYIKTLKHTGYTSSEPGLLDVSEDRVNKGYGLKKLTEYLGLRKEEICVFGDYDNDISMFENAGLPIAMGNSCDELKKYARFVTKSNDDNGVACALKRYIL